MIGTTYSKSSSRISDQEGDHNEQNFRSAPNELPVMTFIEASFNFDITSQEQKISHIFRFRNTGISPMLIYDVKGSWGCTIPNHSKELIMPGYLVEVKVTFDSEDRMCFQEKSSSSLLIC
ncbi:MAG: DUF1573 domain-containing protein [Flavobacteriales bacterium AspAUS03]